MTSLLFWRTTMRIVGCVLMRMMLWRGHGTLIALWHRTLMLLSRPTLRNGGRPLYLHAILSLLVKQSQKMVHLCVVLLAGSRTGGCLSCVLLSVLVRNTAWMSSTSKLAVVGVASIVVDRIVSTAAVVARLVGGLQTQSLEGVPSLILRVTAHGTFAREPLMGSSGSSRGWDAMRHM